MFKTYNLQERELLLQGVSYEEVSSQLGIPIKTISERNRLLYKISLVDSFRNKVQREGMPVRLSVNDAFGYWFSGFFDGEGCLTMSGQGRMGKKGVIRRRDLGVSISLREDDAGTLEYIQNEIKTGKLSHAKRKPNPLKPKWHKAVAFRISNLKDLAEIVVPLFEKYPLHTKKAKEFEIWKVLVIDQYVLTLGGRSRKSQITDEQHKQFLRGVSEIKAIRHMKIA